MGRTRSATPRLCPWEGPILDIADELQGTTVDAMIVGHTHRISNLMRGHILITEGINAGASYSVLQLMVQGGDVAWAGGATRVAKNLGVAPSAPTSRRSSTTPTPRRRCCATRSSAPSRSTSGATRTRLHESEMGNLVADAMRAKYPGRRRGATRTPAGCAPTCSSRRRARARQPGEITWGEVFAVLPFGNRTVDPHAHRGAAAGGVRERVHAGLQPGSRHRALPAGLRPEGRRSTATGTDPVVDGMWKAPNGPGGPQTPIGPTDTVRLVTNDFMYTGGDGYTVFAQGTTSCSRATTCSRSRSTTSRRTRRSPRSWTAG